MALGTMKKDGLPETLDPGHFGFVERDPAVNNQPLTGDSHDGHAARKLAQRHLDSTLNGENVVVYGLNRLVR
jgi:hypothetical protein